MEEVEDSGGDDSVGDNSSGNNSGSDDGDEESNGEDSKDSDEEDEKKGFDTWSQYYQEGQGNNMMEKLLIMFYCHLQDIIGGCKKERHAINHAQNVRRVRDMSDEKDTTLNCFLQDGGLDIWRKWAKPKLDAKEASSGTVRASLASLVKFFEFILDHTKNKVRGMRNVDSETIERSEWLIKRLVAMGSSVNQLYAHEKWEQILEDQVNAIHPSETNEMIRH